jgi:hypothetical protein
MLECRQGIEPEALKKLDVYIEGRVQINWTGE